MVNECIIISHYSALISSFFLLHGVTWLCCIKWYDSCLHDSQHRLNINQQVLVMVQYSFYHVQRKCKKNIPLKKKKKGGRTMKDPKIWIMHSACVEVDCDYTLNDSEVRTSFENKRIHPKCRTTHFEFTKFKLVLAWSRLQMHFFLVLSQTSLYLQLVFPTWPPKNCQTRYENTSRHTVVTLAHTRKCHQLPVTLWKPESRQRTPDFVPVPLIHGCFKGAARLKRACTLHFSPLFFFLFFICAALPTLCRSAVGIWMRPA